jgi:hypothetical protein
MLPISWRYPPFMADFLAPLYFHTYHFKILYQVMMNLMIWKAQVCELMLSVNTREQSAIELSTAYPIRGKFLFRELRINTGKVHIL